MGDDPSTEAVEVEIYLDAGEQGFAEDLGEDPPDWEAPEGPEDEDVPALGDRLPRIRGQRSGVKAQRQRVAKAAAIERAAAVARAVIADAAVAVAGPLRAPAAAPREARAPAAAAAAGAGTRRAPSQTATHHRGVGIAAACATPRRAPQFFTREQLELRHAGRSRSPADDRQAAGRHRGPDYGAVPAAKGSRRRESNRPAQPPPRTPSPSVAPPGKRWARKVSSGSVRAPRSPSPEPAVSLLQSASGAVTVRGSASSARPQELAYLEAQAQLANAKVSAAREAAKAAAKEKARLGIDKAISHARWLDDLRQLIRATDPDRPGGPRRSVSPPPADVEGFQRHCSAWRLDELAASCDELRQLIRRAADPDRHGGPRRPVSPLPADIEGSLHNCSAEHLAELAASFKQIPAATSARAQTPPSPGDFSHPDWIDPVTGEPWTTRREGYLARKEASRQRRQSKLLHPDHTR
ncbi:unnamed protein product [Polarella glacialis]|uniref:Uncharacterized protein n=1 Tax=Polarella glacialis TaxID=89957 RepID=A0A813K6J0_POLGL|nr:unnamed protein product [Polarella glacialis]